MLTAKSMLGRLGVPQTNDQENSTGSQLVAEPAAQPPPATALALPFEGNLNPGALIPVVVQPRLLSGAGYTAPHTGAERNIPNPVAAGLMRGRRGA
jgi:hypothetical protein